MFRTRLIKRAKHFRRWPTKQGITCYRLYERDIPEAPLIVDRYEDCLHISEYERPHERTAAEHSDWLDAMRLAAAEALELPLENVYLKRRIRQKGALQHERYSEEERIITAREGGLKFLVNLSDYVDTGLFLDHRITRGMVREQAAGKRFLNLFCYTGSFTVYAAAGGAAETTSVDLSNTYLDWAKRNFEVNGLSGQRLVRSDVLEFLERDTHEYDLAVVDPPTFSNSKSFEGVWDVQREHVRLLQLLRRRMAPGGVIYFSTNFRRFKLDEAAVAGCQTHEISNQTVPPDFRNRRVHRCWRIKMS